MPKGYWVAHVQVDDPAVYKEHKAANAKPFAEYGASYLVRGGAQTQVEGSGKARTVVIEFPTIEAAHACYNSPDYQEPSGDQNSRGGVLCRYGDC